MLKKLFLPIILVVLAYGFWLSPDFKEITAGVAIFLFGMLSLEEGFKAFSGGTLEKILQKSTNGLPKSISFGIVTTAIMQSSSLVSVLTISFLGAELITLVQGIGIIFGANIGTTTGAWLMAGFGLKVKISAYAMPMLVFGVILLFQKAKSFKGIGYILIGLGFLFLGIHHMKEGFEAFKAGFDLTEFAVPGLKGILIFIGIGILATVVMQSSHATIVLIIAALATGQITYENSLALTIGANIGTTITAIIGSLSSNINGKRLAGAHFIFNVVTGVIAVVIMSPMIDTVASISAFIGIAPDDWTMQLAVFDTLFKVMGVVIFIPFVNKLVSLLEFLFKNKDSDKKDNQLEKIEYLNDSALEIPAIALISISKETKHLYEIAFKIVANGLILKRRHILSSMDLDSVIADEYTKEEIDVNREYISRVKNIYGEILDFSTRAQRNMSEEDIEKIYRIKLANRYIVSAIKATKHLEKNMKIYTKSANKHIKVQYNDMRKSLIEILRDIDSMHTMSDIEKNIKLLKVKREKLIEMDVLTNGTVDRLIRKNFITNKMASSLINDNAYVQEIADNLLNMAEMLFTEDLASDVYSRYSS